MNKSEIKQTLAHYHADFIQLIVSLPLQQADLSPDGKWSPIQLLEHIIKSVSPVVLAFALPGFLLKLIFGKANRPSKSYDALVEKYNSKLSAGGKAPPGFVPEKSPGKQRELGQKLRKKIDSLCGRMDSFSEEELDFLILPHPLLGKLTLREMLYFTIHHVQHHQKQVKRVN